MVIALSAAIADSIFVLLAAIFSSGMEDHLSSYHDMVVLLVGVILLYFSL